MRSLLSVTTLLLFTFLAPAQASQELTAANIGYLNSDFDDELEKATLIESLRALNDQESDLQCRLLTPHLPVKVVGLSEQIRELAPGFVLGETRVKPKILVLKTFTCVRD